MSHAVFAPVNDSTLIVKVFKSVVHEEPEREWEALVAFSGSGLAPEPVHFAAGDPAVVVMTRVVGSSLLAGELGEAHAGVIGEMHRRVHRAGPSSRRPISHPGVRAACEFLRGEWDANEGQGASDVFARAWTAAQRWVSDVEVERILSCDALCFSRGDPNLSNYLWSESGVVLIDWENSGYSDPALELADFAEHASARALADDFWAALADATGLTKADRGRVRDARRLMTCFWLVLIASRQRSGRPTTVTLEEQALRTLAVLGS